MAPTDPAAETMPSAVLRMEAGTNRDVTESVIANEAQAIAIPTQTPAPIITIRTPSALASRDIPIT